METIQEKIIRTEEELTAVRAAITEAQESQSLSAYGRSVTRGSLDSLYKERDRLENKLDRLQRVENGGSGVKYVRLDW